MKAFERMGEAMLLTVEGQQELLRTFLLTLSRSLARLAQ